VKFEPALENSTLFENIQQVYGYPVSALTLLPEGLVGYSGKVKVSFCCDWLHLAGKMANCPSRRSKRDMLPFR